MQGQGICKYVIAGIITSFSLTGCGIYVLGEGKGCFAKGTKITTPSGTTPIEQFRAGDEVLSWDADKNETVVATVESLIVHTNETPWTIRFANGVSIQVTPDHPLYSVSKGEWIPVAKLKAQDHLKTYNGSTKQIEESIISEMHQDLPTQTTYNLKVRRYENSFAEGVLAHFY